MEGKIAFDLMTSFEYEGVWKDEARNNKLKGWVRGDRGGKTSVVE